MMIYTHSVGEVIEQYGESDASIGALFIIAPLGIMILGLSIGAFLGKKQNVSDEGAYIGAIAGLALSGIMLIIAIVVATPYPDRLEEAMAHDIQENIHIDDVSLSNIQGETSDTDPLVVDVLGTLDGTPVGFQMMYNEEYDVMVPIQGLDTNIQLDFQDGSVLEELVDNDATVSTS